MFTRTARRSLPVCTEAFTTRIHGYIMNPIMQTPISVSVSSQSVLGHSSGPTNIVQTLIISYAKVIVYKSYTVPIRFLYTITRICTHLHVRNDYEAL